MTAGLYQTEPGGLRVHLKQLTAPVHDRVERLWISDGVFLSENHYSEFLAALLAIHTRLGLSASQSVSDLEMQREERRRVSALSLELGLKIPSSCSSDAVAHDYAWGILYVLNGSTLGASQLLKLNALPAGWRSSYLELGRDYAKSGRAARFFRDLDSQSLDWQQAARGAMETFQLLESAGTTS